MKQDAAKRDADSTDPTGAEAQSFAETALKLGGKSE